MSSTTPVDRDELRSEIQTKYAEVATTPSADFHFHTGRLIAERCGYDPAELDDLPEVVVESFAGVANPFALAPMNRRCSTSWPTWPPTPDVWWPGRN